MSRDDRCELKSILLKHYELYPKMQVRDLVKLVYQNEFASGHFIRSERESLLKLEEEYRGLEEESQESPGATVPEAFECIGNRLCRLHLGALSSLGVGVSTVNRFFVETANSVKGSISCFEEKLAALRQCFQDKELPFSTGELDAFIKACQKQGYPAVSHSDIYRAAYSPHYRVIKSEFRDFLPAFAKIEALLKTRDSVRVAIDGRCGGGKSTLALLISRVYDCNVLRMDDFFLPPELKTPERLNEPGGNVDYVRFREEVISGLERGGNFKYRRYDCQKQAFGEYLQIKPRKLNIIEGSYSMHPALAGSYDLRIFMDVAPEEQSARILKRNGALLHKRFLAEWIPLENRYFRELEILEKSDLVFRT